MSYHSWYGLASNQGGSYFYDSYYVLDSKLEDTLYLVLQVVVIFLYNMYFYMDCEALYLTVNHRVIPVMTKWDVKDAKHSYEHDHWSLTDCDILKFKLIINIT